MAIVPRKLKNGRISYWVKFTSDGKDVWERAGASKAAAERLERERRAQVKAGTYRREFTGRPTVGRYIEHWLARRTNRTVENDRALLARHVLSVEWFTRMQLDDVRPKHALRLVEEMRGAGRLGEKSIATVFGLVHSAFARAEFEELVHGDPCKLPKGSVRWKASRANARRPYLRQEARAVMADERIPADARIWVTLAFYSGMREGEVCGRRWRDWDRNAAPLTALHVHSQYDDRPLKTDDADDTRPRVVPVHPELERALAWWWSTGFELVFRRKPEDDDLIVPTRTGGAHSKSSGYKMFRRALRVAGVENRTLHATRHTFVSVARSGGARSEVVEQITHNAKGKTIDTYTTWEWEPLCEAVLLVDYSVDSVARPSAFPGSSSWTRSRDTAPESAETTGNAAKASGFGSAVKPAEISPAEANRGASQRYFRALSWGWFRRAA